MAPTYHPIPSLANRIALVTGANTGIGLVTARELARAGARLFITCRSRQVGQSALAQIRAAVPQAQVDALAMDLGDLGSVRQCAREFLAHGLPLHILVNNAGLAAARGLSASGFEIAFGVNHIGHFLFTQLLIGQIRASAPARIVTVSSRAHYRATGLDWQALRKPARSITGIDAYCNSKLANTLFSAELGRRLAGSGVCTYALHPGVVASDMWRKLPWPIRPLFKLGKLSTEEGAATSLYCATAPELAADTGLYYDRCRPRTPSAMARDTQLAAELWQRSEAWTSADAPSSPGSTAG